MRASLVILCTLLLVVFLAGCGGKKQPEPMPPLDEETVGDSSGTSGETPNTDITDEVRVDTDESIALGEEEIDEKPISEMSIIEINEAEFLKTIRFEFDKYDLTDDAIAQLEQNGRFLMENPTIKVIIEGHCDERGTEEYNLALGERRANAARSFLVRFGVASNRLMTASYGESRPVDRGHNEEAWSLNRRAQFRVYER